MGVRIEVKPSKAQFEQLAGLISEEKDLRGTLYHNWKLITESFNKGRVIALLKDERPIGFLQWWMGENLVGWWS